MSFYGEEYLDKSFTQAKKMAKLNNRYERENVKLQAELNSDLAQDNRDWQEMMANSAHQREIKDLKKAGLNPVLSVTGGNGATTPSGSAASVSKPNVDMSVTGKIMDMAMTQLNNATNLQTTAMQTANALQIAQLQSDTQKYMHDTPSGGSVTGQITNLPEAFTVLANKVMKILGYDGPYLEFNKKAYQDYRKNEDKKYTLDIFGHERAVMKKIDELDAVINNTRNKRKNLKRWYRDYSKKNYRFYQTR